MELSIIIEDRTKIRLEKELSDRLGGAAGWAREGAVKSDAPAGRESSHVKLVNLRCPLLTRIDFSAIVNAILAHELMDRRQYVLKKNFVRNKKAYVAASRLPNKNPASSQSVSGVCCAAPPRLGPRLRSTTR